MQSIEILSQIALTLINSDDFDSQMNAALENIGTHLDVSRVYIFIDTEDGIATSNQYEWCNKGILPQIHKLQNVMYTIIPSWKKMLLKEKRIYSENIYDLPQDMLSFLASQSIVSILVYPIFIDRQIKGFVGFDECKQHRKWNDIELNTLQTISGMISGAYERKIIQDEILASKNNFQIFFNSNPAPMAISREEKFIEVNARFLETFGYSQEEVIGKNIAELGIVIDYDNYYRALHKVRVTGQVKDLKLNVKCKDGKILSGLFSSERIENQGKESFLTVMVDITDLTLLTEKIEWERQRLENIIYGTGVGTWEWNVQTGETIFNERWAEMIGYSLKELEPISIETWIKLSHPDDLKKSEKILQEHFMKKTDYYKSETRMKHKNGSWVWILDSGKVIEWSADGQPIKMFGTHTDITKEKEKSEEMERFFSVNLDLLCIADVEGHFIKINKSWTDILGYSIEELEQKKFLEFVHPDDINPTLEAMVKLANQEQVFSFVNRYRSKNGLYRYIEWRSHPYGRLIYAAARDITERIETENKIREISIRDHLTNIYNRRYIYERLENVIAEASRENKVFSISILDIDRFKMINDQYGHQAGDFILKEFANSINDNLRSYDLLGRFGGEEFIIVSMNTAKEQTLAVIERILESVRKKIFPYNDMEIKFTFSAGIADNLEYDPSILSIEKIIEKADSRLYEAKKTGRNKVIIS